MEETGDGEDDGMRGGEKVGVGGDSRGSEKGRMEEILKEKRGGEHRFIVWQRDGAKGGEEKRVRTGREKAEERRRRAEDQLKWRKGTLMEGVQKKEERRRETRQCGRGGQE